MTIRLSLALLLTVGLTAWWFVAPGDERPVFAQSVRAEGEQSTVRPASHELLRTPTARAEAHDSAAADEVSELLPGQWWLALQVLDAQQQPVAGARVELHATRVSGPTHPLTSGEDGVCRVAVRGERWFARATHADVGRSILLDVDAENAIAEDPQRLVLWRPVQVHGVTLDENARGIAGAEVKLEGFVRERQFVGRCMPRAPIRTRADGTFSFEAAIGARGTAVLMVDGHRIAATSFEADGKQQVILAHSDAFRVQATVRDRFGKQVDVDYAVGQEIDGAFWDASVFFSSGDDEAVGWVDAVGDYVVQAHLDGYYARVPVTVSLANPRPHVELYLLERARSPGASPVNERDSFLVDVFCSSGKRAKRPVIWWQFEERGVQFAASEPAGDSIKVNSRACNMPRRLVVADRASGESGAIDIAPGALPGHARIVTQPGGQLRVSVLHRGGPARAVEVSVVAAQEKLRKFVDPDGSVSFADVPVGKARLTVLRGAEVLAEREVYIGSRQLSEAAINVDLSR